MEKKQSLGLPHTQNVLTDDSFLDSKFLRFSIYSLEQLLSVLLDTPYLEPNVLTSIKISLEIAKNNTYP